MKSICLSQSDLMRFRNEKIYESKGKQTSLYECIFLKDGGIGPHIHTMGEDCAVVLSGELTYYISNKDTIQAVPGELVLGWKSVIHGYLNESPQPVHLLIFVTPYKIGLAYPMDNDPIVRMLPSDERKISPVFEHERISSEFSSFSYLTIDGMYKEQREDGMVKVFIDIDQKEIYIFDDEEVFLQTSMATKFLKYSACS